MLKKIILPLVALAAVAFPSSALKYRGMVDISPALEFPHDYECGHYYIDDYGYDEVRISLSVSTTHGMQLSKNHFIGIGGEFSRILGGNYKEKGGIPVYAMWRMDFFGRKITPFFFFSSGYQVAKANGFYGNINGGVRFNLTGRTGLNVSLGVRIRRVEAGTGNWIKSAYSSWRDDYGRVLVRQYAFGFLMRIGVDF